MRSQEVAAADRVLDRIKTITGELESLRADIDRQIKNPHSLDKLARGAADESSVTLSQFKAALDQLRQILWSYLEQVSEEADAVRCGDALALRGAPSLRRGQYPAVAVPRSTPSASGPLSFFDRLDVVIDEYMKKNETSAPAIRKRVKT